MRYLLASNADVNLITSRQDTALHWASKFSNEEVVRLLIQYKSNVNAINSLQYTPLCGNWIRISYIRLSRVVFLEACFYGNLEIVKVLVENGANVNGNQNDQRSPGKKKDQGYPISLILKQVYYQGKKRLYNIISLGMRREEKKELLYII